MAAHPEVEWRSREHRTIYSSHQERWQLVREQATSLAQVGIGLDRIDRLADKGIAACELDAAEFAQGLAGALEDHLTLRELEALTQAFQAQLAARRAEQAAYRAAV